MIELKKITVKFGDKIVLNELDLTFLSGEIIGIVAPNGTGKTTLFHVLMNALKPDSGQVVFDSQYFYGTQKMQTRIYELVSMMPDQNDLYNYLNGYEHLEIYAKMWHKTAIDPSVVVKKLNMTEYIYKDVATYSLGMRQRLCFAMQLVTNTNVMIMDEVMNGLDTENVELISKLLVEQKEKNKCVIIASHLLKNLEDYADRVLFLKSGKIIFEYSEQVEKNKIVKFSMRNEDRLKKISAYEIKKLTSGQAYIEADSFKEVDWKGIVPELLAVGANQIEVGNFSLEDYYSMCYR